MPPTETLTTSPKSKFRIVLGPGIVIFLLLALIAALMIAWKPWSQQASTNDSTISVTGDAKLTSSPDEFVFSPSYEFKGSDKALLLADLTKKSDEIIKKLKELGVADSKIKSNSGGNDGFGYNYDTASKKSSYNLELIITTGTKELAQKVQDYLVTTGPVGPISPEAKFSEAKRKELEVKARDEATKNARAKAEQSGKNLGFKLGKVKSVQDRTGFDNGYRAPVNDRFNAGVEPGTKLEFDSSKLTVASGENEFFYSVSVVYFLK